MPLPDIERQRRLIAEQHRDVERVRDKLAAAHERVEESRRLLSGLSVHPVLPHAPTDTGAAKASWRR